MNVWDTKDYNKFYKDYIYIVIGQEAPIAKDLSISFTVYYKIIIQRYKIVNNAKIRDRIIKVNAGIFQRKYYKWYDNTYIRIKK